MRRREGRLSVLWTMVLALLPVAAALAALGIGRIQIPPADVVKSLLAKLSGSPGLEELSEKTLWQLRMPRIILAALAGAGLSVAGCAFQSLFANPLATPDTLGVASGASFGAALGILLGFKMIGIQLTSLTMGASAVALTWLCGRGRGRGLSTVVLSGIMIGSLFSALVSLVKFAADAESQLPAITYWLMGGLDKANYKTLAYGAPPILLAIVVLWLMRWRMNLLPLSDDEARSSGVHIGALRTVTVICATVMTASVVSMCGQVGWVSANYLSKQATAKVTASALNVRKGPGTNSAILGSLKRGTKVTVQYTSGNWAYISTKKLKGYVSLNYLVF